MVLQLTQNQNVLSCLQGDEGKRIRDMVMYRYRWTSKPVSLFVWKQLTHSLLQECSLTPTLRTTLQLLQHLTRVTQIPCTSTTQSLSSYVFTLLQKNAEQVRSYTEADMSVLTDLIHTITCLCQNRKNLCYLTR